MYSRCRRRSPPALRPPPPRHHDQLVLCGKVAERSRVFALARVGGQGKTLDSTRMTLSLLVVATAATAVGVLALAAYALHVYRTLARARDRFVATRDVELDTKGDVYRRYLRSLQEEHEKIDAKAVRCAARAVRGARAQTRRRARARSCSATIRRARRSPVCERSSR